MGLKGSDGPRFILEITSLWSDAKDDAEVTTLAKKFTDTVNQQVEKFKAGGATGKNAFEPYNPLFMNDAATDQDVLATFKDAAKFQKLQKEIDPNGLFAKRAGGFKY